MMPAAGARFMALMLVSLLWPASAVTLGVSSSDAKGNPVKLVIRLLESMQKKVESEGEADKDIYDKQACWCNTNIEETTTSINSAKTRIPKLTNGIMKLKKDSSRFEAEADQLNKDIAEAEGSLAQATALRTSENTEFKEKEGEVMNLIDAVVKASQHIVNGSNETDGLGEASAGAQFVQLPAKSVNAMLLKLQEKVSQHAGALKGERSHVDAFLSTSFKLGNAFLQRSEAPAGTDGGVEDVQGVLDGVKFDMIDNLGDLRTEETQRFLSYQKLKKSKEAEIKAMGIQEENKKQAKVDADEKRANNKQVIANLEIQLDEDTKFKADVEEKCRLIDKEWEARQGHRAKETEVLAKTMDILSQDSASDFEESFVQEDSLAAAPQQRSGFWGSIGSSFLQEESSSNLRTRVSDVLFKAGRKLDSRLVTLALSSKLAPFERVKESIDAMVKALDKEQKDEAKQKDWCVDELKQNELNQQDKTQVQKMKSAELVEIEAAISSAKSDASQLQKEIEEAKQQIKLAGENREQENKQYQATIPEQRATQKALSQALAVLKGFYPDASGAAALNQEPGAGAPDSLGAPEGFKELKKSSGGLGIMAYLKQLIEDSQVDEAEAVEEEHTSQKSYEAFVKELTDKVKTKTKAIIDLKEMKASKEEQHSETSEEKQLAMKELAQLSVTKDQLHKTCDFVIKQFDVTQQARQEEMDALGQAKAILSGAKFKSS